MVWYDDMNEKVYNELQNPLVRRMRKVMWRSLYLEFALYGCVSLFGYLSFHAATKGNILENYDAVCVTHHMISHSSNQSIAMLITVMLCYVVLCSAQID